MKLVKNTYRFDFELTSVRASLERIPTEDELLRKRQLLQYHFRKPETGFPKWNWKQEFLNDPVKLKSVAEIVIKVIERLEAVQSLNLD